MNLNAAKNYVMPFGKYSGRTLEDIAAQDVLYLDWLAGLNLYPETKDAVTLMVQEYSADIDAAREK